MNTDCRPADDCHESHQPVAITPEVITLDDLIVEAAIHPLAEIRKPIVKGYRKDLREDRGMKPIDVFRDGDSLILAHGFHRVAAAREVGYGKLSARIHHGTRRDALLFALDASVPRNSREDRRTDADRRRSVDLLLADPEWEAWSDLKVTNWLRVGPSVVARAASCPEVSEGEFEDVVDPEAEPPRPRSGKPRIEGPPPVNMAAEEPSDEEYLDRFGLRKRLTGDPLARFDRQALIYRRSRNLASFEAFKEKVRKLFHPRKPDPLRDPVWKALGNVFRGSSPDDWKLCLTCSGSGKSGRGGECRDCHGNGFE